MIAFWRRIPGFWQNFLAGLVIIGALLSLGQLSAVKSWENWAVDMMIRMNGTLSRMTGEKQGRPDLEFAFLEMNDRTYRSPSWNEPYHVPRDKLLKLIKHAVNGKSSLIIVDVDLAKEGTDAAADAALKDYLQNYPVSAPPLILLRNIRSREVDPDKALDNFREAYLGETRKANIHYAQPLFRRDGDSVVRNWFLLKQGCYKDKGVALPSVQLLAYALLKDRLEGGQKHLLDLDASLRANYPEACDVSDKMKPLQRPVIIGKTVFRQQRLGERLIYTMPWQQAGYSQSPDLKSTPALYVTLAEGGKPFENYEGVRDRITLIGASYRESHDLHLTPLGMMPGGLIILNAVKSLSLFEQISPPPLFVRLAFLLGFITVLSFVFSRFHSILKLLIVSALVIVFFVPLSFWFFKYGVWFDFGLLLLGIKLQHTFAEFLEVRELKRLRRIWQKKESEEADQAAGEGGEAMVRPSLETTPLKADGERLDVIVSRNEDGSYLVETLSDSGAPLQFNVPADGVAETDQGYILDLKLDASRSRSE